MANYNCYVNYFVPGCISSSVRTPGKIFLNVPRGENRKRWIEAAKVSKTLSLSSALRCCQDHFNLQEDTLNWTEYRLSSCTVRLKLRPEVTPHIFLPQDESLLDSPRTTAPVESMQDATQSLLDKYHEILKNTAPKITKSDDLQVTSENDPVESLMIVDEYTDHTEDSSTSYNDNLPTHLNATSLNRRKNQKRPQFEMSQVVVKSHIPDFEKRQRVTRVDQDFVSSSQISGSSSVGELETMNSPPPSSQYDYEIEFERLQMRTYNIKTMFRKPRLYFGLLPETDDTVFSKIQACTNLSQMEVCVVLRKVRLNETLDILDDVFGLSTSSVSRILHKAIPLVAGFFDSFIFMPPEEELLRTLPLAYKAHYSRVVSVIDCFEIKIQQPPGAENQSVSWSQYKHANTMKYLIACTPSGFIHFVSEGFSGRISDPAIVEESGWLNNLPPGKLVLADRGFKQIDGALLDANCRLVRPPSVKEGVNLTKDEASLAKVVASLRMLIERCIRRCREFKFLNKDASCPHDVLWMADAAVCIAAGISNMQHPLFQ